MAFFLGPASWGSFSIPSQSPASTVENRTRTGSWSWCHHQTIHLLQHEESPTTFQSQESGFPEDENDHFIRQFGVYQKDTIFRMVASVFQWCTMKKILLRETYFQHSSGQNPQQMYKQWLKNKFIAYLFGISGRLFDTNTVNSFNI